MLKRPYANSFSIDGQSCLGNNGRHARSPIPPLNAAEISPRRISSGHLVCTRILAQEATW
jgi:hypothetical protein